jgi:hypothetical protein
VQQVRGREEQLTGEHLQLVVRKVEHEQRLGTEDALGYLGEL